MKKVRLQLPTSEWQDINTKFAPDDSRFVDQNAFTADTKNIDTEQDGTIRKMKGGIQFATLANVGVDQHEAIFSDGIRHLLVVENGTLEYTSGGAAMTTVTSGYSAAGNFEFATTQNRVYFGNGINSNQVYDKTATYGGVGYSVPQTKDMGAQVPSTTLTATLAGSGTGVPAGGHTYKVTYLYYDSEESNGSSASNPVTVPGGGEDVNLTSIPTGGYGVTARKIYRDNNDDGVYILIHTINDNTTTTYLDNNASGTTPIPTDNGIPPVSGQVKLFLDRLWFAQISGEPFTLYFSEVGLPDIVESTNFIECNQEDPITGLYVYRGRLIVFNRRSMGQILGDMKDSFAYDPIEGSVGCIDNRTIQEITLDGIPILVWLSDKGFYGFNGSSIFYISEPIENIINSNIRQSVVQKNEKVDTTNADFNAGTASDAITVSGGSFTTRDPEELYDDETDWNTNTTKSNTRIYDGTNTMRTPAPLQFDASAGTHNGTEYYTDTDGIHITLDEANTLSELSTNSGTPVTPGISQEYAIKFTAAATGTVAEAYQSGITNPVFNWYIYSHNAGTDFPDSSIGPVGTAQVNAGTVYWLVSQVYTGDYRLLDGSQHWDSSTGHKAARRSGGIWFDLGTGDTLGSSYLKITENPVSLTGVWTSATMDSYTANTTITQYFNKATFPSGTSGTLTIEASSVSDFSTIDATESFSNPTTTVTPTISGYRYWRIKWTLSTPDNTSVPDVGGEVAPGDTETFLLELGRTSIWESPVIDCTADATTYDTLSTVVTNFTGDTPTTVTTEIATSASPSGPWTFVSFGSHTVRQYAKLKITMTSGESTGWAKGYYNRYPIVESLTFNWTIQANLISAEIDTNTTPAGWDIFQTDFSANGGTVVFEMRSASTSPGLSGATWYAVTNGNFPTVSLPTLQYVQWRATLTSTTTNVPVVRSVTIGWLIGDFSNLRAASIFYDKNYYVSLAELGNNENNIIVQFDANRKWRIKRGLGVNTFSFFFNDPYFCSSTSAVVGKFLEGFQDLGTDIEIDIRTRAFDFSEQFFGVSEFEKVPESIILEGRGTGATYDVSYSLDNGATFTNFIDPLTGSTTYATTNDDELFARIFRVDVDTNGLQGAKTIMYRIHTDDEYDIKLHRIKATAFVTRKEPFITG